MLKWFKNKNKKTEERPKELLIKKRIEALYNKLYIICDTQSDKNCKKVIFQCDNYAHIWYRYKLDT